ncbi:hypothetical protein AWM70_12600 [Paenibacillus yonginensis]|uniref:Uncharacterized protein n=1 Tax=Paenibacillus yonginensis TaxID=1462996 RepID=A0A1B1N1Q2_9BACL|nr:hypothetical protein [Paenibacillus yonginensis]ANS75343.1 hypothetical protein AWM70_12600 [Paenibacillus yonginensis]
MKRFLGKYLGAFLIIALFTFFDLTSASGAATVPYTQDNTNPNKYYFVANFYYDIWKRSNGTWTSDGSPDTTKTMSWDYSYTFPDRKITKVDVHAFNENEDLPVNKASGLTGAEQVYETSRYGEMWTNARANVSTSYTTRMTNSPSYGADTVNFGVSATGLLTARTRWLDITSTGGGDLANGVEGRRYFFPSLVTIELEPEIGTAHIKYFNANTGASLNGVDGFHNKEETGVVKKSAV